jgi:hypothetical protein
MLPIIAGLPDHAARVEVDPYVPLRISWPARGAPASLVWWQFHRPGTLLETGFNGETGEVRDVTLVLPGPIARVPHGPPAADVELPGFLPCCDPDAWRRQPPPEPLQALRPDYLVDPEPLRTELGPDYLLVRIGAGDEPAARGMVNGRVRFGISAGHRLLWICVGAFSAEEWTLLEGHAAASLAPPAAPAPTPPPDRPWWRRVTRSGTG